MPIHTPYVCFLRSFISAWKREGEKEDRNFFVDTGLWLVFLYVDILYTNKGLLPLRSRRQKNTDIRMIHR